MVKNLEHNLTTNTLYQLIFQKGSLPLLKQAGLIQSYLDDYGSKKKYKDCLFFLFNWNDTFLRNQDSGPVTSQFIRSVTDFKTFYDFYEVDETSLMLVFRYFPIFREDVLRFKRGQLSQMSCIPGLKDSQLNWNEEVFRYDLRR
jgi:hypothetical protein